MINRHMLNRHMLHHQSIAFVLLIVLAALLVPSAQATSAASSAELLEQGLYAEETVGDLTSAIEIYGRVLEDAAANRPHIAQAQYRLGICHLKRGEQDAARAAFETLLRDYPEEKSLLDAAREELAALNPSMTFGPAPWQDGERLVYRLSLPSGRVLGFLRKTVSAQVVDGIEAWHFESRRFVFAGGSDYGISRVTVDQQSHRPLHSNFRSAVLGNFDATYGADSVTIVGTGLKDPAQGEVLEKTAGVFDNEQAISLLRTLPLEPGFEFTMRVLPVWTEAIVDAKASVTHREACEVPAGDFLCDVVELDFGAQTFWYSTGAERQLVKAKAGGVVLELAEIDKVDPEAPEAYGIDDMGFSGMLPAGWMSHSYRPKGRGVIRFLDPEAATLSSAEIDRCPQRGCPGLEENAKRELAGAEGRFTDFTLRPETWREREIDGRPAISFVGDFKSDGAEWIQYRIYTFSESMRFEYIFRMPAERFDAFQPQVEAIFESLKVQ